ncbi:hypothetical protein NFI96_034133 [Prochilodus magdalenae]|nr:hypothetical protein NFI96_034133 [Prochilodus magdalenae]
MTRNRNCIANQLKTIMRIWKLKVLVGCVMPLIFGAVIIRLWTARPSSVVNTEQRMTYNIKKLLQRSTQHLEADNGVVYRLKQTTAGSLSRNECVCEGDKRRINVPLSDLVFPQVSAEELQFAFEASELDGVKQRRKAEYVKFRKRSQSAADVLIVAEANSPLQYPTQGVEVQPKKSIIIPGLGLKHKSRSLYSVSLTASMGTFDVAAVVDQVRVNGVGVTHMNLSSKLQSALNTQLRFITYTNTIFHPDTVDVVHFGTDGFEAAFTIKIRHQAPPKLYDPGPGEEYNISALVTIATKTFLRYDKLQDLIDSIRQFYPTVTIIVADDSKQPKPVTGPHIEHYIMPFGKSVSQSGWFAGRNLAISQVTTKYVLWVDDDFIFTSNTRLEKMVEVLEKTTLDLVGGAVREVTGYTATYRHTMSSEEGGEEGDCLHIRRGFYHIIEGFPNCVVTDAVINFFMAGTNKLRQVGFDPRLARVAHLGEQSPLIATATEFLILIGSFAGVQILIGAATEFLILIGSAARVQILIGSAARVQILFGPTTEFLILIGSTAGVQILIATATEFLILIGSPAGVQILTGPAAEFLILIGSAAGVQILITTATEFLILIGSAAGVQILIGTATEFLNLIGSAAGVQILIGPATEFLILIGSAAGVQILIGAATEFLILIGSAARVQILIGPATEFLILIGSAAGVQILIGPATEFLILIGSAARVQILIATATEFLILIGTTTEMKILFGSATGLEIAIEFFIDGLGSLHVGSCDDVIVSHASKIKGMLPWGQSKTDQTYSKFRYPAPSNLQNALFYFKNHFKCKTSN